MKQFLKNNGLSIVFLLLFIVALIVQAITGMSEHNEHMQEEGGQVLTFYQYLSSGHFLQATFENFESEFLQMALFVLFTTFLYQKGSAESNDPEEEEEVDKAPDPQKKVPWPLRKGRFLSGFYSHSLGAVLVLLFLLSFAGHWYGSLKDYNGEQLLKNLPTKTALGYLGESRFWFESFQNWQSEFLSVFTIVVLSIFLREKGSSQSKPVEALDSETGE
jgi:hypothetical protein